MPRYAHTETGVALDPADNESISDYALRFNIETTRNWAIETVPDGTQHGARKVNGVWTNPVADEPAPTYRPLTKLEFKRLCKTAGGMTSEMYVASNENPLFKEFWLDFQLAEDLKYDDPDVDAGLAALHAASYLPNGVQAVKAAWPRA